MGAIGAVKEAGWDGCDGMVVMFNEFDVHGLDVTRGLYYYKATYLNYRTIYIYIYIHIEREREIVNI